MLVVEYQTSFPYANAAVMWVDTDNDGLFSDESQSLGVTVNDCSYERHWMAPSTKEDICLCRHCGYCLEHLSSSRCPECGIQFDPHDPRTVDRAPAFPRRRITRIVVRCCGMTTALVLLAVLFVSTRSTHTRVSVCMDCGRSITIQSIDVVVSWQTNNPSVVDTVLSRCLGDPQCASHRWRAVREEWSRAHGGNRKVIVHSVPLWRVAANQARLENPEALHKEFPEIGQYVRTKILAEKDETCAGVSLMELQHVSDGSLPAGWLKRR